MGVTIQSTSYIVCSKACKGLQSQLQTTIQVSLDKLFSQRHTNGIRAWILSSAEYYHHV